jgi:urease accessory protein UreE
VVKMSVFDATTKPASGKIVEVGIKRTDAMRGRIRMKTPDGEDLIVDLPRGRVIHDGNTFGPSAQGTYYRTRIEPEPVLRVTLKKTGSGMIEDALRLGYTLGNHHLEVLFDGGYAYVPAVIGADKIERIIGKSGAVVATEVIQWVISPGTSGYFAGED